MWLRLKPAEKKREYASTWRARNADKAHARDRARYAANPQNRNRHVYASRAAHPEYSPAYLEGWHEANPNKKREYTARRRSRKLAAEGAHTADDIERIFKAQDGRCAMPWCRKRLKQGEWHVDHITPLSKGGTNWPANIQILHDHCNHRKSAKDPIVHARENGMLL